MGRVLVAMSGGVDSSVAAAVLQEDGHEVVGVTMKLWGGESDSGCCSVSDVDDARRVADQLGIEHHVFNFGDDFTSDVIDPYVAAHAAGRTPNPCIECNRHLKFDRLLTRARALGFEHVATGHHARLAEGPDGRTHLRRGADPAKDQSYVLYVVAGPVLDQVSFPIGHLSKADVRAAASRLGLRTAAKPDSQDVCFITSTQGRGGFLADRIAYTPGRVVDGDGHTVGRVDAVELVTIGQRRGLGLAGGTAPRYVVDVDVAGASVVVGGSSALESSEVELADVVWAHDPVEGAVLAQCSAHGSSDPAEVSATEGGARVRFASPRRRVAPGQSVVLYRDDLVVGGGIATRP
jgi:tRNA-specific 2-thiouridylase